MAKSTGLLHIDTKHSKVSFEGRELPITKHWVVLFALMGLKHRKDPKLEPAWITPEEIALLPTWEEAELKSIGTSVFRRVEAMNNKGFALIRSPAGERTKRFALHTSVKAVEYDIPIGDLHDWLRLAETPAVKIESSEAAAYHFALAYINFEKGRYPDVLEQVERGLTAKPTINQWVQLMALRAWAFACLGNALSAESDILELQKTVLQFKREERHADSLSSEREALVWIQTGRFYLRRAPKIARAAYGKAAALLEPHHHRERGAVHAGLCFLEFTVGKLEASDAHAHESLNQFMSAQAFWGVQAQYSNLSSNQMEWYMRFKDSDPECATHHLAEAIRYTTWSLAFAREFDYGGAGEQELNMAYLERLRGNLDAARTWLATARRMVETAESQHDLVMVEVESAELAQVTGNCTEAIAFLEQALKLLDTQPMLEWRRKIKRRLKSFQGTAPMNEPLKLW